MSRRKSRLTIAERAAVLRAARARLQILEGELLVWGSRVLHNVPDAESGRAAVKDEWDLLTEAVRKLWLGVTSDG